jgi:hypothetical protein
MNLGMERNEVARIYERNQNLIQKLADAQQFLKKKQFRENTAEMIKRHTKRGSPIAQARASAIILPDAAPPHKILE